MFINAKIHTFDLFIIKGDTYPKVPPFMIISQMCAS